jgi:hypothetical protein
MGNCAKTTGDEQLKKLYSMYLWSLIVGIILDITLPFIMYFGIYGIIVSTASSSDMYTFMGTLLTYIILIIAIAIIPSILQIIGVLAFVKWSEWYASASHYSFGSQKIRDGMNLLKWGTILSVIPFTSSIGAILVYVGFYQVGTALKLEFGGYSQPMVQQMPMIAQPIIPAPNVPRQNTSMPTVNMRNKDESEPTFPNENTLKPNINPSQNKLSFCSGCGEKLIGLDPYPRFCPKCGKPLF